MSHQTRRVLILPAVSQKRLGVVWPAMCGIGGDMFIVIYPAGGDRPVVLNASGRAGRTNGVVSLTWTGRARRFLREASGRRSSRGIGRDPPSGDVGQRVAGRAAASAANTLAGVTGSVLIETPDPARASHTALAMAAPSPGLPHSPRPRRPSGLVVARTSW